MKSISVRHNNLDATGHFSYIDLTGNKWYYCDTNRWELQKDIVEVVSPVVDVIYKVVDVESKSF